MDSIVTAWTASDKELSNCTGSLLTVLNALNYGQQQLNAIGSDECPVVSCHKCLRFSEECADSGGDGISLTVLLLLTSLF